VEKSCGEFPIWEVRFTTEDTEGTEKGKAEKQRRISQVGFFLRFAKDPHKQRRLVWGTQRVNLGIEMRR